MAKVLERSLYQEDYYAWTKTQAAELRKLAEQQVHTALDLENLAEEVESLGRSDYATVRSQMRRVIEHLLELEHSPAADPRADWQESIIEARDVISDVITPTLRRELEADLARTYRQGRRKAHAGLNKHGEHDAATALPADCPYTFDEITTQDWYPANRHGLTD